MREGKDKYITQNNFQWDSDLLTKIQCVSLYQVSIFLSLKFYELIAFVIRNLERTLLRRKRKSLIIKIILIL